LWLPNINGSIDNFIINSQSAYNQYVANTTGAFTAGSTSQVPTDYGYGSYYLVHYKTTFNANSSNAIYSDNGLILPKSISKQSYIIYK
jgi:hypothetical protein